MIDRIVKASIQAGQLCSRVQKNGTPLRKPKKSGGSPIGVKDPPYIAHHKNKENNMVGLDIVFIQSDKGSDQ